ESLPRAFGAGATRWRFDGFDEGRSLDKFLITGGKRLEGTVAVSGAKNAALPAMAAALLTDQPMVLHNVPRVRDIATMGRLLEHMQAEVHIPPEDEPVKLRVGKLSDAEAPYDLVRTMRASVLVLGPLLARTGYARVSLPGGCAIGARPVDLHIKALEQMGAEISTEHGYIEARATGGSGLRGAHIVFEKITVTGTENLLMAAALAGGGTLLTAAAITGGNVTLTRVEPAHVAAVIAKLTETGATIREQAPDTLCIQGVPQPAPADVSTQEYPGFPTDMQAQYMALATQASGTSVITETIFENRFLHASEMARMGADISIDGRRAVVRGPSRLMGADVMASDLRASAGLVLAALVAQGVTLVGRVYHIDRGYERIEEKLSGLGAQIRRVS